MSGVQASPSAGRTLFSEDSTSADVSTLVSDIWGDVYSPLTERDQACAAQVSKGMNALIAQYRLRIYPDARGVTHAYSPQQMAYVLQLHSVIQQLGAHFSLSEQEQATMVEALNSGSLVYVELHNGANLPSISAQQVSVYPGSRIMDVNGGRVNVYGGTVNAVNNATVSKVTGGTVDIVSSVTVKGFTDGCIAGGRMGRVSIEVVTVYLKFRRYAAVVSQVTASGLNSSGVG